MTETTYGYCKCGCGQKTRKHPTKKEPCKFKKGHEPKPTIQELFWSKVSMTTNLDECWEWQASLIKGYGSFKVNRKTHKSNRVAWELTYGEIPDGLWVLHTCDNPKCCNPNHLYLGTAQDNANDRTTRDRNSCGENRPAHKLTWELVAEIRSRYASGNVAIRSLAREYSVSQRAIQLVVKGNSWKPKCKHCNDVGYLSIRGDETVDCPVCGDSGEAIF